MTDEVSFSRSKNRLCTIPGSDISIMGFGGGLALVPVESPLFVLDSIRTSVIKPRFFSISQRIGKGNVCLHARENHFCNARCTHSGLSVTEAVIIPRKIRVVLPEGLPVGITKVP